jgi:hypothetical protein
LLDYFAERQLKASWGFMARLAPLDVLNAVAARGHEIVLHTEAADAKGLGREVAQFRQQGFNLRGVTAHGGLGSAGHLGQNYFGWAQGAGLDYADFLSRDTMFPHPTLAVLDDHLTTRRLFTPGQHISLDLGTSPDAHQCPQLRIMLPELIKDSEHVTVMNHPDIHRTELKTLLDNIARADLWHATHADIVDWVRGAKFGWRIDTIGKERVVRFQARTIAPVQVRRFGPGKEETEVATGIVTPLSDTEGNRDEVGIAFSARSNDRDEAPFGGVC